MTPDPASDPSRRAQRLRLVPSPPLRVLDVAFGTGSADVAGYLAAKRAALRADPDVAHRVVGVDRLGAALATVRPDVVLLHDPPAGAVRLAELVRALGARLVLARHGPAEAAARRLLPARRRTVDDVADAVLAPAGAHPARSAPVLPLRVGVDRAFRPRPGIARGTDVLYAGPLTSDADLETLLDAAALSIERWPLELAGEGPLAGRLLRRVRQFGLERRVTLTPALEAPGTRARRLAAAGCVVVPGPHAHAAVLEAAAAGARVVCCATAPGAALAGTRAHRFAARDAHGLARAIAAAKGAPRDLAEADALARRSGWEAAFAAELEDVRSLLGPAGATRAAA